MQASGLRHLLGTALGLVLVLTAFVFWKLDQRTAFLVKHAENAIMDLERTFPLPAARLVCLEADKTQAAAGGFVLLRMWTYRTAFQCAFALMGGVGVLGVILSVISLLCAP